MPSEPVLVAMNGVSTSGWPGRPPSRGKSMQQIEVELPSAIRSE